MMHRPQQLSMFKRKRVPVTTERIRVWSIDREPTDVDLVARALIEIAKQKAGIKVKDGLWTDAAGLSRATANRKRPAE